MKRKLDVYLLYFSYVVELIYLFSARIFNNYESTHTIHVSESGKPIFGNMKIYLDISIFSYYLFFAIMILYILFVLLKLKNKEPINLLKNTNPNQSKQIESVLSDPEKAKKLLQSPQAQALMKLLGGE